MATQGSKDTKKKVHPLKRHVYHDRYFAYAVAAIVVAGIALASYVVVVGNRFNTDSSFSGTAQPNKVYTNSAEGYSVNYPSTWVLDASGDTEVPGQINFENPASAAESITVTPMNVGDVAKVEAQFRAQNKNETEATFTAVGGAAVRMYTVPPSGLHDTPLTNYAVVTSGDKAFYVQGVSSYFGAFMHNFKINP